MRWMMRWLRGSRAFKWEWRQLYERLLYTNENEYVDESVVECYPGDVSDWWKVNNMISNEKVY